MVLTISPLGKINRRDHGIYCGSGCGAECRRSDYDLAVERAKALAEHLGKGWNATVWENLGWHYQAVKGKCRVSPTINMNYKNRPIIAYTAFFNTEHQVVASAKTAEEAISLVSLQASKIIKTMTADLADLRDC